MAFPALNESSTNYNQQLATTLAQLRETTSSSQYAQKLGNFLIHHVDSLHSPPKDALVDALSEWLDCAQGNPTVWHKIFSWLHKIQKDKSFVNLLKKMEQHVPVDDVNVVEMARWTLSDRIVLSATWRLILLICKRAIVDFQSLAVVLDDALLHTLTTLHSTRAAQHVAMSLFYASQLAHLAIVSNQRGHKLVVRQMTRHLQQTFGFPNLVNGDAAKHWIKLRETLFSVLQYSSFEIPLPHDAPLGNLLLLLKRQNLDRLETVTELMDIHIEPSLVVGLYDVILSHLVELASKLSMEDWTTWERSVTHIILASARPTTWMVFMEASLRLMQHSVPLEISQRWLGVLLHVLMQENPRTDRIVVFIARIAETIRANGWLGFDLDQIHGSSIRRDWTEARLEQVLMVAAHVPNVFKEEVHRTLFDLVLDAASIVEKPLANFSLVGRLCKCLIALMPMEPSATQLIRLTNFIKVYKGVASLFSPLDALDKNCVTAPPHLFEQARMRICLLESLDVYLELIGVWIERTKSLDALKEGLDTCHSLLHIQGARVSISKVLARIGLVVSGDLSVLEKIVEELVHTRGEWMEKMSIWTNLTSLALSLDESISAKVFSDAKSREVIEALVHAKLLGTLPACEWTSKWSWKGVALPPVKTPLQTITSQLNGLKSTINALNAEETSKVKVVLRDLLATL
jgi:hypothetical protein